MSPSVVRKFLFDTHAFEENEYESPVLTVIDDNAPPPAPVFTQEDLDNARAEGHAAGHAAALLENQEHEERAILRTLEAVNGALQVLAQGEAERAALYHDATFRLTMCAFEKAFPVLNAAQGLGELRAALEATLGGLGQDVGQIVLKVAPETLPALQDTLKRSTLDLRLEAAQTLGPGDFEAYWTDGGAERKAESLGQAIVECLASALKTKDDVPHV